MKAKKVIVKVLCSLFLLAITVEVVLWLALHDSNREKYATIRYSEGIIEKVISSIVTGRDVVLSVDDLNSIADCYIKGFSDEENVKVQSVFFSCDEDDYYYKAHVLAKVKGVYLSFTANIVPKYDKTNKCIELNVSRTKIGSMRVPSVCIIKYVGKLFKCDSVGNKVILPLNFSTKVCGLNVGVNIETMEKSKKELIVQSKLFFK